VKVSNARAEGTVPSGVFLWYSASPGPPSDADCMALVDTVRPSVDKAEDWLWGRVPDRPSDALEFYLFVSEDRIETTFAAEGDYDSGRVSWGPAVQGVTEFELRPDNHPAVTVSGSITSPAGRSVLTLVLRDIPTGTGTGPVDRRSYYCRFDGAVDI
jgi:hypothetical protein